MIDLINSAQNNILATFNNYADKPIIKAFFEIDVIFLETEKLKPSFCKETLLPLFLTGCRSTYLAAVRLAEGYIKSLQRLLKFDTSLS